MASARPLDWMRWTKPDSLLSEVRAMRIAMYVAGAFCLLTGCVWILQGINILPGSFMTGQTKWAVYGALLLLAGIGLLLAARRGRG